TTMSSIALASRTRVSTGASSNRCFGEPNRDAAPAARTTAPTTVHIVHAPVADTYDFPGYASRGEEAGYALGHASTCDEERSQKRVRARGVRTGSGGAGAAGADPFERAPDERPGDVHLVCSARQRRRFLERVRRRELPRDRRDACQREADSVRMPRRGHAYQRERPLPAVHRLEVDARVGTRRVDLEDQLARLKRRDVAVVVGREPVQVRDRELPGGRSQPGA